MHEEGRDEIHDDVSDIEFRQRRQRATLNRKIIRLVSVVIISLFLAHLLKTYL